MLILLFLISFKEIATEYTNWSRLAVNETHAKYLDASSDLFTELFETRKYRKELSPVYSQQPRNFTLTNFTKFNVDIQLAFLKVFELNAQSQTMVVLLEFLQFWTDPRLSWVQADFNGIERFWLAYDQVWIPENSILECSSVSEAWPDYRRPVRVQSSGRVFLDTQQIVTIACPMDLGTFPFDSQLCPINFGLPSYMVNQVSMTGELFDFDYKSTAGMGEWSVTNITMIQYQVPSEISPMDVLRFEIHLKRVPHFYIYVIVLPSFILTFLSVIGMFWTPNAKDEQLTKLSIGLTSMMSMTIFVQMVSEQIPRTSTFPLLGIFVIVCVAIISFSCVVLVMFSARTPREKERKAVPIWPRLRGFICSQHFTILLLFQMANIANFCVLLSYWR